MMRNRQHQTAGDGANQYQANTIVVQNGIDKKRAREICKETFDVARKELTEDAYDVACSRVTEFENTLIPKMQKIEGALEAFKEPSFQFLLTDAHRTAASTNRPADYALLSELLIHRIQRGENKATFAGISRAVKIVDEISDDALLALSVAFAVTEYYPASGNISTGLDVLEHLFAILLYGELPHGNNWLDHLDILAAVRLSAFGTLKRFEDFFCEKLNGYCVAGIKKDSETCKIAHQLLSEVNLSDDILTENTLNPEYLRLSISTERSIDNLTINVNNTAGSSVPLSDAQKDSLHKIYALYDRDSETLDSIKCRFLEELVDRPNLQKVREWWNSIPTAFSVTAVGRVLAHANTKRCDNSLPDLD